jgi:protein deglycase
MKALLFLADGFEEVEAVTPIDFLRRVDIDVVVAGVTGRDVVGSHNIRINTDAVIDEISAAADFDAVVVPGGMPGAENLTASQTVLDIVRRHFEEGKLIAAICAAPAVVLSEAGVLDGRKFTCYPGFEKRTSTGTFVEDRVCTDGNLITARGAGVAAEFSIAVIGYLLGTARAEELYTSTLQNYL